MILLVDNYDSFVYNLKRYLVRLGQQVVVARNDQLDLDDPALAQYEAMVISPGPQSPDEAGVCLELVRRFHERVPMLGVCLGHQAIWQALGGRIVRAKTPVHGRGSMIDFMASAIFAGMESPFMAGRYHSLVAEPSLPPVGLKVTAWSAEHEIMAFEHERWPLYGLQFHPESILTVAGYQLLHNFWWQRGWRRWLALCRQTICSMLVL
jgi:anthranilate synthase/aminodeoxychorismate synthase-like glutamine amidotransferase